MRGRLAALTTRGRAFLTAGIAAACCALVMGEKDLLRVALFLLALPIVTVLFVARTRYRIAASRIVEPARTPAGRTALVRLRLENVGRLPTGLLLLEDRVPYALGARPRFLLDRMSARRLREVSYQVRSDVRGRFAIGPLSLRVTDPFGLVELTRSFRSRDSLLVTPEVVPLSQGRLAGEWAAAGESRPRAVAAGGAEDVTVREYHDGDDLRRVHWRSSARRGELMVRRQEQPWQSRATVLLDTRRIGHRGSGPTSSFEWAVSAAASTAIHLLYRGYTVRLVTDTGATITVNGRDGGASPEAENMLLDALAVVETSAIGWLSTEPLGGEGTFGLLIGIFGGMSTREAQALTGLRHRSAAAFGLLLDTPTWAPNRERSPQQLAEVLEQNVLTLGQGGWRTVPVRADDSLPERWGRLLQAPAPGGTSRRDRAGVP